MLLYFSFDFFSRNFFERYRDLDGDVPKPEKFTDCAKVYNDCKDAEKYNNVNDDEDDENQENQENQEKNDEKPLKESDANAENSNLDETDENEGAGDSPADHLNDSDESSNNVVRRKRTHQPVHNFKLNRKMSII